MKRPKKFDVRKKLKFQNGVMVPTSKIEKEAVKMGRSIHNEIKNDSNFPQKATTDSGKHFLISQNSSSTSMQLSSLVSPKRKSAGVSSGFPLQNKLA